MISLELCLSELNEENKLSYSFRLRSMRQREGAQWDKEKI